MNIIKKLIKAILERFNLEKTSKRSFFGLPDLGLISDQFDRDDDLILSYSMGKVGSKAVAISLEDQGFNVIYLHYLNDKSFGQREHTFHDSLYQPSRIARIYSTNAAGKYLRNRLFLDGGNSLQGLKIISGFREPVDYLVSTYFDGFSNYFSSAIKQKNGVINFDTIREHFLERIEIYLELFSGKEYTEDENYSELWHNHKSFDVRQFLLISRWPLIWFDRELKGIFDFDIYSKPFDKQQSYGLYRKNEISILIMKWERFNELANNVIAKFINRPEFRLKSRNVGLEKDYGNLYRDFRSSIVLPKEFLELQYSSKYSKFFYTEQELDQFKQRWSGGA